MSTEVSPSLDSHRSAQSDLFVISFTILFLELACIRWLAGSVVFLTFFTNIVLIACFLGMCVGLLASSRKQNFVRWVLPLLLVTRALSCLTLWGYNKFSQLTIDVGGQASPQQIYFGTEDRPKDPSRFVIPIEAVAAIFFVLVALIFVGLGQVMGRAFDAIDDRVRAYTTDILGSLAGIASFGALSYLRASPAIWFLIAVLACLYFLRPRRGFIQVGSAVVTLLIVLINAHGLGSGGQERILWSPYYKINYDTKDLIINTNNIAHQQMVRVGLIGLAYRMPHRLNTSAGQPPFENVLIIGAGSGNDTVGALLGQAKHIDAVEIDPLIYKLGKANHPERPYDDPRVTVHLDDGRSFLRKTKTKYDLVVYALVDSLVLHSGYSSLRLESFLFTEEAFRDIKAVLKPDGVFAMYNLYRQGWVVGRLDLMAQNVFGTKPLTITLPHEDRIMPSDSQAGHITFLLVGNTESKTVEKIEAMFAEEARATDPQARPWKERGISPTEVVTTGIDCVPHDDWPFLYLRDRAIPNLNVRGMVIIGVLSLVILAVFAPVRTVKLNWQMFFLGAGFMLLETKGVVHMALLFGSTWVVNSIVFAAILVMILLSNLFVLRVRPKTLWGYYALLGVALLANSLVPMSYFLNLPGIAKIVASCALVFVPIFFAGVIFATAFRDSTNPGVDFGSNVAGIILGGLSEYFSLVLGFNHLLLVAIGFYFLSMILKPRICLPGAPVAPAPA